MPLYVLNGTWNSEKTDDLSARTLESDANTNVIRLGNASEGAPTFYPNGRGARLSWVGKLVGFNDCNEPRSTCVTEDAATELIAPPSALFKE